MCVSNPDRSPVPFPREAGGRTAINVARIPLFTLRVATADVTPFGDFDVQIGFDTGRSGVQVNRLVVTQEQLEQIRTLRQDQYKKPISEGEIGRTY
jgi:hypothetical protein